MSHVAGRPVASREPEAEPHGDPAAAEAPVQVRGLVKKFGTFHALDGVDLTVERGTVHGFLGPNGAGKSTAIRVLLGLYRASSGTVRVLGMDPGRRPSEVTRNVSYIPGDTALWPNLTGRQVLDVLAGLRGRRDAAREEELMERFSLDPTKKVRSYSTGNRKKVMLVAAFAAPTDLLILDEPTSGLDPLMEQIFQDCVEEASAAGRTVLLSSHILSEVERLCTDVTIIKDGVVVESGSLARLQHLAAVEVTVHDDDETLARLAADLAGSGIDTRLAPGESPRGALDFPVDRARLPVVLAKVAVAGSTDVRVASASLEDLFLRHYEVDAR
ncbi:ABC transporter ATP-binding protein [Kocuria coralli]|uniref:ABC transporter ATP-binding protein n=1 Tax=Kocuria coralli TaxID=1461025 RepID=A0A5J5KX48_9MICC|nr:ABC transporter ATP-binding protein [Kocuria coralli]KAA9394253.1 ABC transporter ATP-binding protein [Kocuria coralli]